MVNQGSILAVSIAALILTATGACRSKGPAVGPEVVLPTPANAQSRFLDLQRKSQAATFDVLYDLERGADGREQFNWRQAAGLTRWDEVEWSDRGLTGQAGIRGRGKTVNCLWAFNSERQLADATCTVGFFATSDLEFAISPPPGASLDVSFVGGRTIAGAVTECYESQLSGLGLRRVCFSSDGVPLLLDTPVRIGSMVSHYTLTARAIRAAPDADEMKALPAPDAYSSESDTRLRDVSLEELALPNVPLVAEFEGRLQK